MAGFPVDPSSVTAGWLSEVLAADVRECRLEQIAIGVGLLGRLYRGHLDGGPEAPRSVVVKLPLAHSEIRSVVCEDLEFYLREVRFYQKIGLANPLRPARPYFAAFDETTHDFMLVLEDLGRLRVADQIVGCTAADAETVIDAIARHHAYWWESRRFAALPWLKSFGTPPFPAAFVDNFEAAWPRFLEGVGANLSPALRVFGERFPALIPWFWHELTRPPHTFLHGDLRLDQLFFGIGADDPPVTALDWQITSKGRGAYDVAYFLSQSLAPETRRSCESQLVARSAFAQAGAVTTESMIAFNKGDYDRSFVELMAPEMRIENRSRSAFPDRSAGDLRATSGQLNDMVASVRMWLSAVCWLSPAWLVARLDREAVGPEGEPYAWTRLMVSDVRDGRIASMCEFEADDEEAAFATCRREDASQTQPAGPQQPRHPGGRRPFRRDTVTKRHRCRRVLR